MVLGGSVPLRKLEGQLAHYEEEELERRLVAGNSRRRKLVRMLSILSIIAGVAGIVFLVYLGYASATRPQEQPSGQMQPKK